VRPSPARCGATGLRSASCLTLPNPATLPVPVLCSPDIVNWVKKKTGPATTLIESAEALDKATKGAEVSLVGYFGKPEGDDFKAFEALAQKTDDATFIVVTDAKLAKSLGISAAPGFAVGRSYPDFDFEAIPGEGHAAMAGDAPLGERLAALLTAEKLPAFLEFSPASSSRIFNSGVDKQVIVVAPATSFAVGTKLRKDLEAASAKTRGQVVWVTSKLAEPASEPIVTFFGIDADSPLSVVGFSAAEGKKFAYPEGAAVDAEGLLKFAQGVVDGTAPRRTKSAAVPEEPLDEGVTVVVGSTFESIVKDPSKDVLLEVYAPWCGHCKTLAPIYSKLAKRFAGVDSVVIAKMDGTENEHPEAEASGYPTLLFFPAQEGAAAVKYEGARELKDMTKFLKANAKVAFELPKKADKAAAKEAAAEEAAEEAHDEL
jgi:protein disulfide-isomerase A1